MSVNRSDIQTPEDGLDVSTREPKGAQQVRDDIERVKKGTPAAAAELESMRGRIDTARAIKPEGEDLHCSHCAQAFTHGRDAAIKAIEG